MKFLSRLAKPRAAERASTPDLYRRVEVEHFSGGDNFQIVGTGGMESVALLPSFVVDFLSSCSSFRTAGEHLQRYAAYHDLNTLQVESLDRWLPQLIEAGLLISAKQLEQRARETVDRENVPAPITMIGIPTGGRIEHLRRAVESFVENVQRHGRSVEFAVADSSADASTRAACRALLREIQNERKVSISYAGLEEKTGFADALARESGCDRELLDFALFDVETTRFACGANRTALMLHGIGGTVSLVDDDMICRIATPRESAEGVSFFGSSDPFERWFYPDRASALSDANFVEADYLALHEALLGRDPGTVLADADAPVDLERVNDGLIERLLAGRGRILATFSGCIGDPGMPTSYYFLRSKGETFKRLTVSEAFYRAVLPSRSVTAMVHGPMLGDLSVSPGMAFGLDQRELLPPFFPVLHAEDFIYGATLRQCCPHAFSGHPACALYHEPGPRPTISPGDLNSENRAVLFEFAHIMRALVLSYKPAPSAVTTEERMRGLGRHLRELGAATAGGFLKALRLELLKLVGNQIASLEYLLKTVEEPPDFWERDVEAYLDHLREALGFDDYDIPYDLKSRGTPEEMRGLMQRLILNYGRLLETWPEIYRAAGTLRRRGIRLAAPL